MSPAPQRRTYPVLLPRDLSAGRVVRKARRAHPVARGLVVLCLLAFPLLGRVWLEAEAAQAGYRLRALRQEVAQLDRERQRLRSQVAALRAPQRLEQVATLLGLRPPAPDQLAAVQLPAFLARKPAPVPQLAWWQSLARVLRDLPASAAEPQRP